MKILNAKIMLQGAVIMFSLFVIPALVMADEASCDTSCGVGEKMTSFADGNVVSCACAAEAQMIANVANPEVQEGDVNNEATSD